jgi:TonB family protein
MYCFFVIMVKLSHFTVERGTRMRSFALIAAALTTATISYADVSYKVTRKVSGGKLAQAVPSQSQDSSHYLKGHKAAVDNGFAVEVLDFEAHSLTRIYKASRRYTVIKLSGLNTGEKADTQVKADARQTGQKKILGGNTASELLMTVEVPDLRNSGSSAMKMEIDMWLSHSVPGAEELRSVYTKNGGNFPWEAIGRVGAGIPMLLPSALEAFVSCFDYGFGCAADRGIQTAVAGFQSSIGSMNGIPVEQVIRVTAPVNPFWVAFLHGAPDVPGPLIEMTMDATNFSTDPIADSLFAIPNGYTEGPPPAFVPPDLSRLRDAPPAQGRGPGAPVWGDPLRRLLQGPSPATAGTGPSVTGPVDRVGGGVSAPSLISRIDPEFSEEARAAKLNGSVLLSIVVDTEGHARDIRIVKSLGMGLDEKAAEAVAKWKFKPGMKEGVPVNVRAVIEVNFRSFDDPPPVK